MPDICRSCLNDSRYRLTQFCPNQKEAIQWNDNCMLRFSNRYIFGIMETKPLASIITKGVSDLNKNKQLQPLFDSMKSETASGTSRKFATRNSSTIYMLAQCTPDLLEAACSNCLDQIYRNILPGTGGGRFCTPSCNYRFESYSSPPSPLSPPSLPSPTIPPTKGKKKLSPFFILREMLPASKNDTKFQISSFFFFFFLFLFSFRIVILDFSVYLLFETL